MKIISSLTMLTLAFSVVVLSGCYTQYQVAEPVPVPPPPEEPQPDRVVIDQVAWSDSVQVTKYYYDEEGNEETVITEYHPYRYRRYFQTFESPYWYQDYAYANPVWAPVYTTPGWSFSIGVGVGWGWGGVGCAGASARG